MHKVINEQDYINLNKTKENQARDKLLLSGRIRNLSNPFLKFIGCLTKYAASVVASARFFFWVLIQARIAVLNAFDLLLLGSA
jgi:hypothetical protein